jgi:Spherulation-specific family 4
MRYTRKVFAVCIATAAAMVASLLAAVPAPAAPIPYPVQNPGGDLTTSIPLPYSASDVTAWAHNILAPSFGLSTSASLTAVGQTAADYAASIPTPPSDLMGGSPPDTPPLTARDAATFTVTETSTTTSTLTVTITASAVPLAKQATAALVAWVAGIAAYLAACFIVGIVGATGLPLGTTTFAQLNDARPGLVKIALAAGFGAFNIAVFATNDAFLGIELKGAIWASIIGYAILDAGLGATVNPLMAWWTIHGGRIASALMTGLFNVWNALSNWFSGPYGAGSAEAIQLANLAMMVELERQAEALGFSLGVSAMGAGGFVWNPNVTIGGRATCADGGFGHSQPIPGDTVAVNVCNGNPNQYWRGYNQSNCTDADWQSCADTMGFQITSEGLCLSPYNEGAITPQNMILAWCDGSAAQLWLGRDWGLENYASDICCDISKDLCLDASGGQVGLPLDDHYCDLSLAQRWHGFDDAFDAGVGPSGLQVAVASYIYPTDAAWDRLIAAPSAKESVLVANVLNGPGSEKVAAWGSVIDRAHASGKKVLGYVDTGYFGLADQRRTRLGSLAPADWFMQIEADINAWYRLYGASMDGIFFDDGFNACGAGNVYAAWYRELNDYAKRHHRGALTVLNPGIIVPQCYDGTADILLTYEGDYNGYVSAYTPLGWTPADSELWHIIYNTGAGNIQNVVDLAEQRGAGYVEITDDVMPNPYDTLPSDAYWLAEQAAVAGGYPAVAGPTPYTETGAAPATPAGLTLSGNDYSSATLTWPAVAGASRYLIDVNGESLAVPATMTGATIGGLTPGGHPYSFTVSAQGANGSASSPSNAVTATTLSLPGGKTVSNVSVSASASSTMYTANFLVPYAFHRVYVWYGDSLSNHGDGCEALQSGWPVNYNSVSYVCTSYMIEGSTLFRYTGNFSGEGYTWSWTPVGSVQVNVNGYTYTWTVPIGTSTAPTTNVVIQAEGYDPLTNIFVPCNWPVGPDGNGRYCG